MPVFKKPPAVDKPGLFSRLRHGLQKTRTTLFSGLGDLLNGKAKIDAELLEEIETRLIMADVGIESTTNIINTLASAGNRAESGGLEQLTQVLHDQMVRLLAPVQHALEPPGDKSAPFVILVVGVNGSGKTTTIGKMTHYFRDQGYSVMLAAGDTFRAAAIEQIQEWGRRTGAPVIAQKSGADSAAVIYDALQSARARNIELLIADTAGRLHNKENLMEELHKIRRIIAKFDAHIPVEVMLVLDAGTGQNALTQAGQFHEIIGITGITLTKLDGTAKGGIVFALAERLGIPIRFIGIGEQLEDLRPFDATAFVDALLDQQTVQV